MANKTLSVFDRIRLNANPVAKPESYVIAGNARFTVLTSRLLRLEWSENGQFEDRATFAFINRQSTAGTFQARTENGVLTLDTGALLLTYKVDGGPFTIGNLSIRHSLGTWTPGAVNTGNLRGTRRTLDTCTGEANLSEGLLSRDGWTVFDDSKSVFWTKDNTWIEPRLEHARQDWYFFGYGHDYKAALADYAQFGGNAPLIPRFVLGAWWSRFWAYTDQDLRNLVGDFRAHDLPLDVLVIDMDWHLEGWTGYTWNRDYFPDPEGFLRWAHDQGLRATLNLHPADGVGPHEKVYSDFARALGHDTTSGAPIPFRIATKRYVQHYFEKIHHPMEEQGVDFWWMDWQQGESSEMKGLDPLMWLNHLHFNDSLRRGRRAMLYSRWGGLGNQRYYIGFSGDTHATWDSLAFQPYFTATASNVGYGWWSHDIGGHIGATAPELYARWVQFGALSPCLRLHSTKDPLAERRPWAFPEPVFKAAQAAFKLRYALVPYLYSMAHAAAQSAISLCRPMYYEYPDAESAYLARYQYFLGDQIIAAPIVHPADPATGVAANDVWVPEGTWIDYQTKARYSGPRWVRLTGDLNRVPMLVKAGGIIPMAPPAYTTDSIPKDSLILSVFPGADGQFELYEDDNTTPAYQDGQFEITSITTHMDGENGCALNIAPVQGQCSALPDARSCEIRLEGTRRPDHVQVNGSDVTFTYDADELRTVINIPKTAKRQPVTVHVTASGGLIVGRDLPAPEPFVRVIEYTTLVEALEQLATVIIGHPADDSQFKPEVRWQYEGAPDALRSREAQNVIDSGSTIVRSDRAFSGEVRRARWSVEVSFDWQGKKVTHTYKSKTFFPALARWQSYVYNQADEPLTLKDVLNPDGTPKADIAWHVYRQIPETAQNIVHPYSLSRIEGVRPRVKTDEPHAAFVVSTIDSPADREVVVELWYTGEKADITLNGAALQAVEFTPTEQIALLYDAWYNPHREYYKLPLRKGANTLVIHTTPRGKGTFWGIGAVLFDLEGRILCE